MERNSRLAVISTGTAAMRSLLHPNALMLAILVLAVIVAVFS